MRSFQSVLRVVGHLNEKFCQLHTRKLTTNLTAEMKYLSQAEAAKLDGELFSEYQFDIVQLMELAGLSCASSITEVFPDAKDVLIIAGPGNNGGDGLVCARHLKVFGYSPQIYYPKKPSKYPFDILRKQCEFFNIPFLESLPDVSKIDSNFALVIDALFGFSFKPPVRQEFVGAMHALISITVPCCSIDIPSGWDVENGPDDPSTSLKPTMLISLTAPKLCAKHFHGQYHYLGGRFIPSTLANKFGLVTPQYLKASQCVKL